MILKVVISRYGMKGVLLQWPARIDEAILREMTQFIQNIQHGQEEIANIHHAYHEVLIQYKNNIEAFSNLKIYLKNVLVGQKKSTLPKATLWFIPVCYDEILAPDLSMYLEQKEINLAQLIALHTESIYTIYFTGFLPGFLYMGGLDNKLAIDRKSNPSRLVKKGTVAIGGSQTGVYPQDSPGGWYGIGYTPISFFDAAKKVPTWSKTGDKIQFLSVTQDEIKSVENEIEKGTYAIKSSPYES